METNHTDTAGQSHAARLVCFYRRGDGRLLAASGKGVVRKETVNCLRSTAEEKSKKQKMVGTAHPTKTEKDENSSQRSA